jgi:hypothetical protein
MHNACEQTDRAGVLGKAVLNAGKKLGLSQSEVGEIVGRDRSTISRKGIEPESTSGKIALLLVRVYRGLYALVGGEERDMKHWMNTRIRSLQGVPAEMVKDITGLVHVVEYIDAMRGKS